MSMSSIYFYKNDVKILRKLLTNKFNLYGSEGF